MPVHTAIWKVGSHPVPLKECSLLKEQTLEQMIVAAPSLLFDEWMLIGRQESTGFGGRIDLLAVAPDGSLVLIELKRDRTPREVVAQALDYASWVERLRTDEIAAIYGRFAPGHSLEQDLRQRFGQVIDDETLNQSHQIVIVASSLDDSSERIVKYLSERNISINVLCFQVFAHGQDQLLSRSWLLDPVSAQVNSVAIPDSANEPWNGEFYCSFGDTKSRSWKDAVKFGFISAGGGVWYSRTLRLLAAGDRVWVKIPDTGFVGVGRVTGRVESAADFRVTRLEGQEAPILEVAKYASYHREYTSDPDRCEYFVQVEWLQTVPLERAISEIGLFGNQNTVCKPTTPKWRYTVDVLRKKFPNFAEVRKQ